MPENQESIASQERAVLYKDDAGNRIIIPKNPHIPLKEGLQVQIFGKHDQFDQPREVLKRYLFALGSAKVIAESALTSDAWANTRIENGQEVNAYGRVPGEANSWRKPVNTFDRGNTEIESLEPYQEEKLKKLFSKYMPKWGKLGKRINLFNEGINGKDIDKIGEGDPVIWENDNLNVAIIRNPHLNGYHLVVNPKESFARQWQTVRETPEDIDNERMVQSYIQSTLEATAVAIGIRQLLSGGRGEIHNSGNWAGDLKSIEEGGKMSLQELAAHPKKEKKSHRPDIAVPEKAIATSMHAHVYIPESGSVVILPAMSIGEAKERKEAATKDGLQTEEYDNIIKQWEDIEPLQQEQLAEIRNRIGSGKLNKWLEDNCQGELI